MKYYLALLLVTFIVFDGFTQEFIKSSNDITGIKLIKYHHQGAQIILQKTLDKEVSPMENNTIDIGLYVFNKTVGISDFMNQGAVVSFDDGSYLTFKDDFSFNFLYSGKHQLYLKHTLTEAELKAFQVKRIVGFRIADIKKSLDKWESERVQGAVNKIISENIP